MRIESVASVSNSTTSLLANGATFPGSSEDMSGLLAAFVTVIASGSGTLYMEFSQDGINWDYSEEFTLVAATLETHQIQVKGRYYRTRLTNNSGADYTYLRLQTMLGGVPSGADSSQMSDDIATDDIGQTTKSVIHGKLDSGKFIAISATPEGHQEIAIHSPLLPFGSVHTEGMESIFQTDAVYGINPTECNTTVGINVPGTTSATNTGTNNLFKCSTGTTAYSFSTIQSRKRLRYRAGQGVIGRFTALYSAPAANSILVAGVGTGESGYYFGYNGTSFGILHSTGGKREIQTLTVTTGSTATNDYVVTLGGTAFTVTATNNGSTTKTAYEISQGTYTGWSAEQRGATVVFLASAVGNKAGTFSLAQTGAGTPAAGTFAETLAGVASTDTWIPQASWNGDTCDGSGNSSNRSGFNLDPAMGNVYQIDVAYLGFGAVTFKIMTCPSDSNNQIFLSVHTIRFPNTQTTTNVSQPSFPFTMAAYSAGSTTDVSVSCGSFAGFIEGKVKLTGPRMSFSRDTSGYVGSTTSVYYPLFTIRNDLTHAHSITEKANQSVVNLLSLSCSHDDATPVNFYVLKNATLLGVPSFTNYSTSSCIYWDVAATTCTIVNNEQIIFNYTQGQNSGGAYKFEDIVTLQPGETITLAARAVTGTATYVNGSLNTREDQ